MRGLDHRLSALASVGLLTMSLVLGVSGTAAAGARTDGLNSPSVRELALPAGPGSIYTYKVRVVSTSVGADFTQAIGQCTNTSSSGSCSVSQGKTVNRTVSVGLGMSKSVISAQLGFSGSWSSTTTVGCSWSSIGTHRAYAYGTHKRYVVEQWRRDAIGNLLYVVSTSNVLNAFNPNPAAIYCGA